MEEVNWQVFQAAAASWAATPNLVAAQHLRSSLRNSCLRTARCWIRLAGLRQGKAQPPANPVIEPAIPAAKRLPFTGFFPAKPATVHFGGGGWPWVLPAVGGHV